MSIGGVSDGQSKAVDESTVADVAHNETDAHEQHQDSLPTASQMKKAADFSLLDASGNSVQFSTLYKPSDRSERTKTLIIFVRHFFCGLCQDYTTTVCSQIPPSSLPPSANIAFVGCGSPDLIAEYASKTDCQYPIYADPTHKLYNILGMNRNLDLGRKRPDYQIAGMPQQILRGIYQTLASGSYIFKGGNHSQLGGEFLFDGEELIWCHRMTNTRSHTEVPVLKKLLENA